MRRMSLTLAVLLVTVAVAGWLVIGQRDRRAAALPAVPVPAVLVGQAYPERLVVLQLPQADGRVASAWPASLSLVALHAAGAALLPPGASAVWEADLAAVQVPVLAGMPGALLPKCAAAAPAQEASGPASGATYAQHDSMEDYFDPGMPDNCQPDEGVARYRATASIPAAFPVLAIGGMGTQTPDYSVAGTSRPLTQDERAAVERYLVNWRSEFRKAYDREFDANEHPMGGIPTVADARLLVVLRDPAGRAVLRVSTWGRVSVAQHLYRVLVIDRLEDGNRPVQTWQFVRSQGVLG